MEQESGADQIPMLTLKARATSDLIHKPAKQHDMVYLISSSSVWGQLWVCWQVWGECWEYWGWWGEEIVFCRGEITCVP